MGGVGPPFRRQHIRPTEGARPLLLVGSTTSRTITVLAFDFQSEIVNRKFLTAFLSTFPPPDQNPPTSHTQSQFSLSPCGREYGRALRALVPAPSAPLLHSDPPSARPASVDPVSATGHSYQKPNLPAARRTDVFVQPHQQS